MNHAWNIGLQDAAEFKLIGHEVGLALKTTGE